MIGSGRITLLIRSTSADDLDRQWFQSTGFKPQPKLVFDFRYLLRRQSITVYSK
jgi:hypothetical protein